ncbi:hypothetical protein GMRT_14892 [Giardia muris]|uniref:Uncharacterized protein n=1 Tax=Giardia muris TaxID=5742 RepID=A0A4Z1T360_GIAMU|nr:hypothetical protein GMRT_14892 [Giardia muris]|eukprot:TNJ26999.1 hypothetical protein GMRT_14892 [Giardia muris]
MTEQELGSAYLQSQKRPHMITQPQRKVQRVSTRPVHITPYEAPQAPRRASPSAIEREQQRTTKKADLQRAYRPSPPRSRTAIRRPSPSQKRATIAGPRSSSSLAKGPHPRTPYGTQPNINPKDLFYKPISRQQPPAAHHRRPEPQASSHESHGPSPVRTADSPSLMAADELSSRTSGYAHMINNIMREIQRTQNSPDGILNDSRDDEHSSRQKLVGAMIGDYAHGSGHIATPSMSLTSSIGSGPPGAAIVGRTSFGTSTSPAGVMTSTPLKAGTQTVPQSVDASIQTVLEERHGILTDRGVAPSSNPFVQSPTRAREGTGDRSSVHRLRLAQVRDTLADDETSTGISEDNGAGLAESAGPSTDAEVSETVLRHCTLTHGAPTPPKGDRQIAGLQSLLDSCQPRSTQAKRRISQSARPPSDISHTPTRCRSTASARFNPRQSADVISRPESAYPGVAEQLRPGTPRPRQTEGTPDQKLCDSIQHMRPSDGSLHHIYSRESTCRSLSELPRPPADIETSALQLSPFDGASGCSCVVCNRALTSQRLMDGSLTVCSACHPTLINNIIVGIDGSLSLNQPSPRLVREIRDLEDFIPDESCCVDNGIPTAICNPRFCTACPTRKRYLSSTLLAHVVGELQTALERVVPLPLRSEDGTDRVSPTLYFNGTLPKCVCTGCSKCGGTTIDSSELDYYGLNDVGLVSSDVNRSPIGLARRRPDMAIFEPLTCEPHAFQVAQEVVRTDSHRVRPKHTNPLCPLYAAYTEGPYQQHSCPFTQAVRTFLARTTAEFPLKLQGTPVFGSRRESTRRDPVDTSAGILSYVESGLRSPRCTRDDPMRCRCPLCKRERTREAK